MFDTSDDATEWPDFSGYHIPGTSRVYVQDVEPGDMIVNWNRLKLVISKTYEEDMGFELMVLDGTKTHNILYASGKAETKCFRASDLR